MPAKKLPHEDIAWVLADAGRRRALRRAWEEYLRGEVLRPPRGAPLNVRTLHRMAAQLPPGKAKG